MLCGDYDVFVIVYYGVCGCYALNCVPYDMSFCYYELVAIMRDVLPMLCCMVAMLCQAIAC